MKFNVVAIILQVAVAAICVHAKFAVGVIFALVNITLAICDMWEQKYIWGEDKH